MIWLLMIGLMAADSDFLTYEDAYKQFQKSKKPVVIVVTMEGCRFCGPMKGVVKSMKEDYPEFIICEVPIEQARSQFDFLDLKKGVPQTFMYAYDNERGTITRFAPVVGHVKKAEVYKKWGIPVP